MKSGVVRVLYNILKFKPIITYHIQRYNTVNDVIQITSFTKSRLLRQLLYKIYFNIEDTILKSNGMFNINSFIACQMKM